MLRRQNKRKSPIKSDFLIEKQISFFIFILARIIRIIKKGVRQMTEGFVSLAEAASLEKISYTGFCTRMSNNLYEVKKEIASTGGKERIFVALSSLSKKAQRAFKKKEEIEDIYELEEEEIPWYIDVDINWFIENSREQYYKNVELAKILTKFINSEEKGKTALADKLSVELGIGQRTLYRYVDNITQSLAWSIKMEAEEDKNFDYFAPLSLCRKPRISHTFPSLSADQKAIIENIWFNKSFATNRGTIEMLYEAFENEAIKRGWETYPSAKTVGRYVSYCMNERKGNNAHFLAANGDRKFRNVQMIKSLRDASALEVMEFVQGDEHTFDCWVSYTMPNGKVKAVRPKLVCWIDTRTRCIMGDVLCVDANSDILKKSMVKMIYSSPGGIPKHLHIDNGKDYTSKQMTGQNRKDRVFEAMDPNEFFDEETIGFYRSIGIQEWSRSLPYQPWGKGHIERFFNTVNLKFTRWMDSYVGTLTASKTACKIEKDAEKMLAEGRLLTMEEFYDVWTEFKETKYHVRPHNSLKKEKQKWLTPISLFENAEEHYRKPLPSREYVASLLMRSEIKPVKNIGITHMNTLYTSDELAYYVNQKVRIKWDVDDITRLYVYTLDGTKICEAESAEMLKIAPKVPQAALEKHMQAQKRQMRETREMLKNYNMTPEMRSMENATPQVVGKLDLIIKADKKEKEVVVASVGKNTTNKKATEDNDFFSQRGADVLYKLKSMENGVTQEG